MAKNNDIAVLFLIAILALFIAVESAGLDHYDNSDENVYFYMSHLVSQGNLPYRDFFYAHPPLELLFGSAVFAAFGFNLLLLKLIPLVSMVVAGILVFLIARDHFGDFPAVLSAAFFFTAYRIIAESTYFMGLNIALMFLLLGFFFMYKRPYLAGFFFAIAGLTRLLVLVPVAILAVFLLLKNPKNFFKMSISFAAIFVVANIILLLFSPNYLVSVYKFHLLKPMIEGNSFSLLLDFVIQNILLVGFSALLFVKWNRRLLLFAVVSASYILFLAQLSRIFNFYFIVAIPFLAIIAGVNLDSLLRKANYQKLAIAGVAVIFLLAFAFSASRLLSFDFKNFEAGKEMAQYVKDNSNANDVVFGDVGAVPLVALMSGRRIMGNLADTNELVYLSGVRDLDSELSMIEKEKPRFVIVRPLYGIGSMEKVQIFLQEKCKFEKNFKDPFWADFLVFDCR